MNKTQLPKFFYLVAAFLAVVFCIHSAWDVLHYEPFSTSAPVWVPVLVNAAFYLLPSAILVLAGAIFNRKYNRKPK